MRGLERSWARCVGYSEMELRLDGGLRLEVEPFEEKTIDATVCGDEWPLLASRRYAEPLDKEDDV